MIMVSQTVREVVKRKPVFQMSLDEIVSELKELEQELPRPFVQVVTKVIRSKGHYYTYAYLQWREGKKMRSRYLGKEVPEDIAERIALQARYKALKRELKKRLAGVGI